MPDQHITIAAPHASAATSATPLTRPVPHPAHLPQSVIDPNSYFLSLGNLSVHYKLWPSLESTPQNLLLCLHGFGASAFSFKLFQPYLNRILPSHSLLAYDSPGFGLTSRPSALHLGKYTSRFSSSIAARFTEAYAVQTSILGHSLGSVAAVTAVIANPTRYKAVILVAPALLPSGSPLPKPVQNALRSILSLLTFLTVMASVLLNPLFVLLLRRIVRSDSFWQRGLSLARSTPVPQQIIDGYKRPMSVPRWENGVVNFTRAAFLERARGLNKREDLLQQLAARPDAPPVLIVHGAQDRVVPLSNSRTMTELLPNAKLVVMEDCGHVPHEEKPEQFANVVKQFLDEAQNVNSTQ